MLIALKLFVLWTAWGNAPGFDRGDFFYRAELVGKGTLEPALQETFWAYHPPLGFLLTHIASRPSGSVAKGVQIVNTAAMILALCSLRWALKIVGIHRRPAGIVALCGSAGLPVIIHGGIGAHLDTIVYCVNAVSLALSLRIFASQDKSRSAMIALPFVLAAGLMAKFSALLACFIPLIVAFIFGKSPRKLALATGLALAAMLVVSPYYYQRYYVATGAIFPSANDWQYPSALALAKAERDRDPAGWWLTLFSPSPVAAPNEHCMTGIHLSDAWRDVWIRDRQLEASPPHVLTIGIFYSYAGIAVILCGLPFLIRAVRKREAFGKLGMAGICVAGLQIASLAAYSWTQCIPDQTNAKALYVMPATWILAFSAAALCREGRTGTGMATAAFILTVVNHILPVY